jgi:hypothetical protein
LRADEFTELCVGAKAARLSTMEPTSLRLDQPASFDMLLIAVDSRRLRSGRQDGMQAGFWLPSRLSRVARVGVAARRELGLILRLPLRQHPVRVQAEPYAKPCCPLRVSGTIRR